MTVPELRQLIEEELVEGMVRLHTARENEDSLEIARLEVYTRDRIRFLSSLDEMTAD